MTAARLSAAALLVVAALPARAFQRTCDGSTCLAWPSRSITWKVNTCRPSSSPSCAPTTTSDPAVEATRAAFAAWDGAACTDLSLPFGGTTTSIAAGADISEHVVIFRRGWCSQNAEAAADPCSQDGTCGNKFDCFDDAGSRSTLALTSVLYSRNTGVIADADIEIVDWDGRSGAIASTRPGGWYFTCYDPASAPPADCSTYGQANCVYEDLQNTLTHEVGHFLGLAHPCGGDVGISCNGMDTTVTMYPTAEVRETQKRDLHPDDIDGICAIYPAGAALTAAAAPAPLLDTGLAMISSAQTANACVAPRDDGGGGGCTSAPGATAGALLAVLALTLRRGRRGR